MFSKLVSNIHTDRTKRSRTSMMSTTTLKQLQIRYYVVLAIFQPSESQWRTRP